MARKIIPAPTIDNVGAGNTAVLKLPIGPTYEKVLMTLGAASGLDIADIEYMEVLVNGDSKWKLTLQELYDLNAFYNRSADTISGTAAEFMINFLSQQFNDPAYVLSTGWGTGDLDSLEIQFKIAATAPASLTMSAEVQIDTVPQPLGAFVAIRPYNKSSSVTGEVDIDSLPKNGPVVMAWHFCKADITHVEIEANQTKIVDASKEHLERFAKDAWPVKRVPVTARMTSVDFLLMGLAGDVFNTKGVTDLRAKATFGTTGALKILAETLETLPK